MATKVSSDERIRRQTIWGELCKMVSYGTLDDTNGAKQTERNIKSLIAVARNTAPEISQEKASAVLAGGSFIGGFDRTYQTPDQLLVWVHRNNRARSWVAVWKIGK